MLKAQGCRSRSYVQESSNVTSSRHLQISKQLIKLATKSVEFGHDRLVATIKTISETKCNGFIERPVSKLPKMKFEKAEKVI